MKFLLASFFAVSLTMSASVSLAEDPPLLVIEPDGHSAAVHELLFTPDGEQLISLSEDKTIRFWDLESGEPRRTIRGYRQQGATGMLQAGAISPDGRLLAVGGILEDSLENGGLIRVHDVATGEVAAMLSGHNGAIKDLKFSNDGKWLASVADSGEGLIRIWRANWETDGVSPDVATPEYSAAQVLDGHTAAVYAVSFSSDGLRLVTASLDHTLILWQRATADEPFQHKATLKGHRAEVRDATFSPDGKLIVSGGFDRRVLLWDGNSGELKEVLEEEMGDDVISVKFSPDGKYILAASTTYEDDMHYPYLAVYDFNNRELVTQFWEHDNTIMASAWHPSKNIVISTGGDDNAIFVWHPLAEEDKDIAAGDWEYMLFSEGIAVYAAAFPEAGGLQVAYGQNTVEDDGTVEELEKMFDFEKLAPGAFDPLADVELYRFSIEEFRGDIAQLNDNHIIEIGERGKIDLGPYDDGGLLNGTFTPQGDVVVSTEFSLKQYSDKSGEFQVVHDFVGHLAGALRVSPSADGRYLASASSDQTLRLWSLKSGELLASLFVASDGEWVVWTPSGHYHASPGGERYIGWHFNHGLDKIGEFYPSFVFRDQFHHPELVARTIALGDFSKALAEVGAEKVEIEKLLPPRVDWVLPARTRGNTVGSELTVRAEISSLNGDLEEVKLLLNGKSVVADFQLAGDSVTFEETVQLEPGENRLTIFSRNSASGNTSEERIVFYEPSEPKKSTAGQPDGKAVSAAADGLKPNLYVLSVGVSDYENEDIALDFCDDDAAAVARIFEAQKGGLFKNVEVKLLVNSDATREAVLDGLDWLEKNATQKDFVVLFLAAHGANDPRGNYYMLPTEGEFKKLRSTAVAWADFSDVLGNLPSRTLMFLDTCHSGQLGKNLFTFARRGNTASIDDASEAIRELTSDENGVVIMSASTGAESSVEHTDWGHGAFTMALIEGLERHAADLNDDGIIHLRELDYFISDRVKELTKGIQHPTTVKPSTISRLPVAAVK